eukprot:gene7718-7917_t
MATHNNNPSPRGISRGFLSSYTAEECFQSWSSSSHHPPTPGAAAEYMARRRKPMPEPDVKIDADTPPAYSVKGFVRITTAPHHGNSMAAPSKGLLSKSIGQRRHHNHSFIPASSPSALPMPALKPVITAAANHTLPTPGPSCTSHGPAKVGKSRLAIASNAASSNNPGKQALLPKQVPTNVFHSSGGGATALPLEATAEQGGCGTPTTPVTPPLSDSGCPRNTSSDGDVAAPAPVTAPVTAPKFYYEIVNRATGAPYTASLLLEDRNTVNRAATAARGSRPRTQETVTAVSASPRVATYQTEHATAVSVSMGCSVADEMNHVWWYGQPQCSLNERPDVLGAGQAAAMAVAAKPRLLAWLQNLCGRRL